MHEVVIKGPEVGIVEKIKKARGKDKEVVRVVEEMKKAGVKVVRVSRSLTMDFIFLLAFYLILFLFSFFFSIFRTNLG